MTDWAAWVGTVLRLYVVVMAGVGTVVVLGSVTPYVAADPVTASVWFTLVGFCVLVIAVAALGYARRE